MGERLTWKEIQEKYPHQFVGIADCQPDSDNFDTAIVKYTDKIITFEELFTKATSGEVWMKYTTPDEDEGKPYNYTMLP